MAFPTGRGSLTLVTARGRSVHVRHILPEDDKLLVDLFERLSPETRRLRFMSSRNDVPPEEVWREAVRLSHLDPLVQLALIGLADEEGQRRAVGVARMALDAPDALSAEFAIVLRDDVQGERLGTQLFDLLVQVAMVRGLTRLHAIALTENRSLLRLVQKIGLPYTARSSYGEMTISLQLRDDG